MSKHTPSACAVIVAGGTGTRAAHAVDSSDLDAHLPKQFQLLGGKAIIAWSIEAFAKDARFSQIIIVCAPQYQDQLRALAISTSILFAPAGQTRTASVRAGLEVARRIGTDFAFIHDAARPGLDQSVLDKLFQALDGQADGAAPMLPVADALWHTSGANLTLGQDRSTLARVQTPQAFALTKLLAAYETLAENDECADDVGVARAGGLTIVGVTGSERLDKITWPQDFVRMTNLLVPPLLPRTGTGFDAHKFAAGDNVNLCGISIPHSSGLAGHSDADVGWHALADAIYGSLSAGDIGHHFPPSESRWKGAASSVFLSHAREMVRASGGVINHVDVTLICEMPKIGPHREAMITATAQVLGLRNDQVSIKATTTEGMGFTGRREGIAAQASATILLPDSFRQAAEVVR